MEVSLTLEQFKLLALQYQKDKKKGKEDINGYVIDRYHKIRKRCKYFK